jgi:threonyl-tRNA synthetase
VVPIADRHAEAAHALASRLGEAGLRVSVDDSRETVPKKIRSAQLMKVPYTLVMGDREIEAGTVSVRDRADHDTRGVSIETFIAKTTEEAASRALESSTFESS